MVERFYDYATSLSPAAFILPKLGHLESLVSISGSISVAGIPKWIGDKLGFALAPNEAGGIIIPDGGSNPGLQTSAFTAVLFMDPFFYGYRGSQATPAVQDFFCKADGTATDRRLFFNPSGAAVTGSVLYGTASGTSTFSAIYPQNARSITVSHNSGDKPLLYVDGNYSSLGGTALSYSPTNADINVGRYYSGVYHMLNGIQGFLWFPSILTSEEIATLHESWIYDSHIGSESGGKKIFYSTLRDTDEDLLDEYLMKPYGVKITSTKSSHQGTLTGTIIEESDIIEGSSLVGYGTSQVSFPIGQLSIAEGSVEGIFRMKNTGPDGMIFSDLDNYTFIRSGTGNRNVIFLKGSSAVSVTSSYQIAEDKPVHVVGTWWLDGTTQTMELFVNGVSQGTNTYTSGTHAETYNKVGWSATNDKQETWCCNLYREWSSRITAEKAQELYTQTALACRELSPRFQHPVSLATVTSGECGPYQVEAGSFQWNDNGTRKILTGIGASDRGHAFSDMSYGGWYFKGKKYYTGGSYIIHLLGNQASVYSDSGFNGYLFILAPTTLNATFYRINSGVVTSLGSATDPAVVNEEFEVFITRSPVSKKFKIWMRTTGTWVTVGEFTDSAPLTIPSKYFSVDIDDGDTISDVRFFPMGGNLDPNDISELN